MTEYSHCPDCSAPLGKERTKCRCGWMQPQAAQVQANPNHIPCSADSACRKPGRLFVEGMKPKDRICIVHYYQAIERGAKDAEPPKRLA
jgi:hypothetical protein